LLPHLLLGAVANISFYVSKGSWPGNSSSLTSAIPSIGDTISLAGKTK